MAACKLFSEITVVNTLIGLTKSARDTTFQC